MNFNYLINRSWSIVKTYRALWWLGLLSLSSGGMGWFGPGDFGTQPEKEYAMKDLPQEVQQVIDQVKNWVLDNPQLVLAGALFFGVLLVLAIYVALVSRAGLVIAVNGAEEGKQVPVFKQAYVAGRPYAGRLFLSTILAFLIVGLLIAFPVGFLAAKGKLDSPDMSPEVIILMVIGMVGMVVLEMVLQMATRFIVLKDQQVVKAFSNAFQVLRSSFFNLFLAWLIQVGLSIAIGIMVALLAIPIIIFVVLLGILAFVFLQQIGLIVYAILAGLALFYMVLLVSGLISAYFSAYWTLVYRAVLHESRSQE